MKSNRMKLQIALMLSAVIMLGGLSLGVRQASAYLTSHAKTTGYATLDLDDTTTRLDDEVANWEKQVAIANTGEGACQVRAKFFVADKYADYITYASTSPLWTYNAADGYWYFDRTLEPGEKTAVLTAKLDSAKFSAAFDQEGSLDFNVIVVHEYARVQYDTSGGEFVDWSEKVIADTEY